MSYAIGIPLLRCRNEAFAAAAATAFLNVELSKTFKSQFGCERARFNQSSSCSLWFSFHPVFQPPLLNIMHFAVNQPVRTCTRWIWPYPDPGVMLSLKTEDTSCVKTSRVLTRTSDICRDKQQREEAIELRQAPKSVRPCYPKGGKNQCSPF